MIKLTDDNYFSHEASMDFMSCSQWKSFHQCEEKALAEIAGDYTRPSSTALLVGSYVDSHFEGTLDIFKAKHPEIFKRDGNLKAEYTKADEIIQRVERSDKFMRYMSGEKQVIMTGEIAGVPFKIKIDSYHPDKSIVDLKCMKDFEPIWNAEKHCKEPFVEAWGYDIQGAIYQEIVRQNTGKQLPFIIAGATKQTPVNHDLMYVPQERLDECLSLVKALAPRYQALKQGKEENPSRCEKCDWCLETKILTEIVDYRDIGVNDYAD